MEGFAYYDDSKHARVLYDNVFFIPQRACMGLALRLTPQEWQHGWVGGWMDGFIGISNQPTVASLVA